MDEVKSSAAHTAWRRRLWFVQQLAGSAFMAYSGWTQVFGGPEWVNKGLLICAGLGLGIVFVELERGR